jgi:hypothetical protein
MRGELRSEFAFNDDYPIATLAIESAILDEKWAHTHPDLAAPDEVKTLLAIRFSLASIHALNL